MTKADGDFEMVVSACPIRTDDQLLKAVQSNDLDAVRKLREFGLGNTSVNLAREHGEPYLGTILDVCCMSKGRAEFAEALLSLGANANAVGKSRRKAAVHLAAANECADALLVLVAHPSTDVNLQVHCGRGCEIRGVVT